MVRSGGEDNDCRATNHRVRQNAARLHGSLSGRSDHAAESRYRVVGGSNNLSACRYGMGGVDSMLGFVGGRGGVDKKTLNVVILQDVGTCTCR